MITFRVYGLPQTAGSKKSYVPTDRKTGQPFRNNRGGVMVSTVDDNPKSRDWKETVASAARQEYSGPLLDGAVELHLTFYLPRPLGHFGTGRNAGMVKDSSPHYHAVRPDLLKMTRAVEDALIGVIWRDDAQICKEILVKHYGEPAGVNVFVYPAGYKEETACPSTSSPATP